MIEFYIIGDNNMYQGPYSKDELRSKGINSDTLVWCTGMRSWKKASEVPEVEDLLLPQPPALTQQGYSSQSQSYMQEPQEEYVSFHDSLQQEEDYQEPTYQQPTLQGQTTGQQSRKKAGGKGNSISSCLGTIIAIMIAIIAGFVKNCDSQDGSDYSEYDSSSIDSVYVDSLYYDDDSTYYDTEASVSDESSWDENFLKEGIPEN